MTSLAVHQSRLSLMFTALFFRTTIHELENLVYSLEPSAEFNKTMLAEQYHQSMSVDEVPDTVAVINDEDISDNSPEENE